MNNNDGSASWKTKEDVVKDLGVIGQAKISDDYLIIGSRPPPPLKESNDDEFDLRFGGTTYSDVTAPPDLNGIQSFLKMLKDDEGSADEEPMKQNGEIVISKLNPLVKEFVPKSYSKTTFSEKNNVGKKSPLKSPRIVKSLSSSQDSIKNASKNSYKNNLNSKTPSNSPRDSGKVLSISPRDNVGTAPAVPQKECVNNQDEIIVKSDNTNDDSMTKPKDIFEKTNELRNKISETLKSDSPKHKKERNVAIANLLRLHSAKPSPCSSKSNISEEKELKLYTPDYFKNTKDVIPSEEIKDDKLDDKDKNIVEDEPMDSSVQESIEKVNNWFEPKSPTPISIKSSTVCMGPVSFKRKDANGKSPTGDAVDTKIAKGNASVAQFKPSKYADDLAKKYMERSQDIERGRMTIWDNVEKELKKKDELIRQKQAANRNV